MDTIQVEKLDYHPLAELFPLMEGEAYSALTADIAANGLHHPIVCYSGKVLDGRNRYRACLEVGASVRTTEYTGDDPLGYVVSTNLQRRHLDESQRAIVAAKLATMREGRPRLNAPIDAVSQPQAATLLNVSRRSVQRASKVLQDGTPDLVKGVERGQIAVSVAANATTLPPAKQDQIASNPTTAKHAVKREIRARKEADLAEATRTAAATLNQKLYGVLLVDPPWRWEPYSRETGMDRSADNHYPTMTIDDLKALNVPAAKDCVLFLWATIPMLPQALDLMAAWGFAYKSHCVWAKDKAGTGYWFREQHELLLVGTKGDVPAPAPGTQYASVLAAPRSRHSAKPMWFHEVIEELFPSLPRLEMFARGEEMAGWDRWGNEIDG